MRVIALNMFCRNCQAWPGEKCTQPTNDGRAKVEWFHLSRESDAILENSRKENNARTNVGTERE